VSIWRYVFIFFVFTIWTALSYGVYDALLVPGRIVEWQLTIILSILWLLFFGIVYVIAESRVFSRSRS
jgi:hypothetical protein